MVFYECLLMKEAIVTIFFPFGIMEPAALSPPRKYMYMEGYEIMYVRMMRSTHKSKSKYS